MSEEDKEFPRDPNGKLVDYYAILGVAQIASTKEIQSAYRKLALKYHPDKKPGDQAALDHFRKLGDAKDVLTDADERDRYDSELRDDQEFGPRRRDSERERGHNTHHRGEPRSPREREPYERHERGYGRPRTPNHEPRSPRSPGSGRSGRTGGPYERRERGHRRAHTPSREPRRRRRQSSAERGNNRRDHRRGSPSPRKNIIAFRGYQTIVLNARQMETMDYLSNHRRYRDLLDEIRDLMDCILDAAEEAEVFLHMCERKGEAIQTRQSRSDDVEHDDILFFITVDLLIQVLEFTSLVYAAFIKQLRQALDLESGHEKFLTALHTKLDEFVESWLLTSETLKRAKKMVRAGSRYSVEQMTYKLEEILQEWNEHLKLPDRFRAVIEAMDRQRDFRYTMSNSGIRYDVQY